MISLHTQSLISYTYHNTGTYITHKIKVHDDGSLPEAGVKLPLGAGDKLLPIQQGNAGDISDILHLLHELLVVFLHDQPAHLVIVNVPDVAG